MSNFGRGSFLVKAEAGDTVGFYQDLFQEGRPWPVGSRRETVSEWTWGHSPESAALAAHQHPRSSATAENFQAGTTLYFWEAWFPRTVVSN